MFESGRKERYSISPGRMIMSYCFPRSYGLLCALLFSTVVGFGTTCDFCVCAIDTACSSPEVACSVQTGCTSVEFTPPCNGTYTFELQLRCPPTSAHCEGCLACAYIYQSGTQVDGLQSGCNTGCFASSDGVTLTGGVTYKLYACLRTCAGNCTLCSDCDAFARVYHVVSDCTAPCN
jgi:hypothetical protein